MYKILNNKHRQNIIYNLSSRIIQNKTDLSPPIRGKIFFSWAGDNAVKVPWCALPTMSLLVRSLSAMSLALLNYFNLNVRARNTQCPMPTMANCRFPLYQWTASNNNLLRIIECKLNFVGITSTSESNRAFFREISLVNTWINLLNSW